MPNEVDITITANDLSGPGFDSAMARMARLRAEAAALSREMGNGGVFKIDKNDITSSLITLKSKMQSLGIADIADVNVQPGRLATQLNLLKRLIQQAGISDILDVNVNSTSLSDALHKIASVSETIPVKFDVARMPTLGPTSNLSEHISLDINPGAVDALNGKLRIMGSESMQVAQAVKDIKKGFDGIGLSPATLSAMNAMVADSRRFSAGLGDLGPLLESIRSRIAALPDVMGRASEFIRNSFSRSFRDLSKSANDADMNYRMFANSTVMSSKDFRKAAADLRDLSKASSDADLNYRMFLNASFGPAKGMADAFSALAKANRDAAFSQKMFTNALLNGIPAYQKGSAGMWFLNGGVEMFGGQMRQLLPNLSTFGNHMLAFAANWHILAEAIIETAGTLIPAAIGFATFGAAAAPTVQLLYNQMNALNTVSAALGKTIYPLSGGFDKMVAAVRPDVLNLFGQGLEVVTAKSGLFATVAAGAGQVMKDLGARMTYAIAGTQGLSPALQQVARSTGAAAGASNTLNTVLGHSVTDLKGWGTGLGNLSGILGGIMKVLPGYAEMVMNAFNGVTHVIETLINSGAGQWFLKIGLAAHGAIFYIGLLSTAFAVLATRGLQALGTLAAQTAGLAAKLGLESVASAADSAALAFGSMAELPWGWIGLAAAGFGFLVYQIINAKSAAQQFNQSMLDAAKNSSLSSLSSTLSNAIVQTQQRLTVSTRGLTQAHIEHIRAMTPLAAKYGLLHYGVYQAASDAISYTAGLKDLRGEQHLVNTRVDALGKAFGGTQKAWAALNAAGITSNQMLDKNAANWAKTLIQVQAANNAFQALSLGVGRSAAAMNAMVGQSLNSVGDTFVQTLVPAAQKVTQAEDQMMQVLTAGSSNLDAFMQNMGTLAKDSKAAGASMGGTTQAAYAMNGAFYQSVTAAQKTIDALTMQQATDGQVTTATATLGSQLLKYAGHNEAARIAVVDLINNALGPGTVSLKSLDGWIKKNGTSLSGLNAIIAKSQISASHLAGVLQQDLNVQFEQALLKSSGATTAISNMANAIAHGGANTAAYRSARAQLIADLEKTGMSAQQAQQYVKNLQNQIDNMHGKSVLVTISTSSNNPYAGGISGRKAVGGPAAGGGGRANLTLVGEHGPELVRLPPSSWVYSNSDSQRMASEGLGGSGGSGSVMRMEISSSGHSAFEQFMLMAIRNWVRVKGGGNVQKAFGR